MYSLHETFYDSLKLNEEVNAFNLNSSKIYVDYTILRCNHDFNSLAIPIFFYFVSFLCSISLFLSFSLTRSLVRWCNFPFNLWSRTAINHQFIDSWILNTLFQSKILCPVIFVLFFYPIIRCKWIKKMAIKSVIHSLPFPHFRLKRPPLKSIRSICKYERILPFFSFFKITGLKTGSLEAARMNMNTIKAIMFRKWKRRIDFSSPKEK